MPADIRIVLAEDHPLFRDGLRRALVREPGFQVVAEAGDGATALEQIRALRPDVAILDVGLPEMNGCALVRAIRGERIPLEVVFLTVSSDAEIFDESLEYDVKGYLLKDCTDREIVRCVRAVMAGQHCTSPELTTRLVERTRRIERFTREVGGLARLTGQERAILRRIAQGRTSKEIAQELGIAPKTVDAHRSNICHKLEIHGNHGLTKFALLHKAEI